MQVMPRDGRAAEFMCINGPCFSARPSMEELFDPQFNIEFGVKLLSGLVSKYGTIRDGLKAYGPMDRGYDYADLVLAIYDGYQ
jgi:soluble lytic murein transglycosylase-like protein